VYHKFIPKSIVFGMHLRHEIKAEIPSEFRSAASRVFGMAYLIDQGAPLRARRADLILPDGVKACQATVTAVRCACQRCAGWQITP
jgi:hypothetical protein